MDRGQAERLLPLLEGILATCCKDWRNLAALAVCTGPGNFTGIRVGVAAARGLALALDIPAIGVTRLEALAHGRPGPVLVALDARRGGLYAQTFHDGVPSAPPALTTPEGLPRGFLPLGAAARAGTPDARETPDPTSFARIAATLLGAPQPPPAPLYLRPADADPAAEAPPRMLDDA